ncbi:MAG: phosphatidylglycerophosphatase A, partial [Planctomycetota bacterium]
MNRLKLGIVSCGFLGCAPFMPGTFGTLGGVLIAWAIAGTERFPLWLGLACVIVYLVGRSLGEWSESHAGKKDPQFFVLDEVVGYLIAVAWVSGPSPLALTVAFIAFRFFDIVKPPPV